MEASIAPGQGQKVVPLGGSMLNASKEEMMREKRRAHSAIIEATRKRKEHRQAAALADVRDSKRAKGQQHDGDGGEEESEEEEEEEGRESGEKSDGDRAVPKSSSINKRAASASLKLGEGGEAAVSDRFRDPEFFVPDLPGSVLQEEEAYSIGRWVVRSALP
jgi:hypothetical protein